MTTMTFDQVLNKIKYLLERDDSDNLRTVSFEFEIIDKKYLKCKIANMKCDLVDEVVAKLEPEMSLPPVDKILNFLKDECNLIMPIDFEAQLAVNPDSSKLTIVDLINIRRINGKTSTLLLVPDRPSRIIGRENAVKIAFCDLPSGCPLPIPDELTKSLLSNSEYLVKNGFVRHLSGVYKELKSIKENIIMELNKTNEVIEALPEDIRLILEAEDNT